MKMVNVCVMAAVAGTVVSGAQAQNQTRGRIESRSMAAKLEPVRVAKARMIDGQAVRIGEWQTYVRPGADAPDTPYVDFCEFDALGNPVGFCTSGCGQLANCPAAPPDSRWWFGGTEIDPFIVNDMTVAPGTENLQSTRTQFAWNWGPVVSTQCYVAVFTAEDFVDCAGGPPGFANDYDGVIYDFGPQTGGPAAGYFAADNDLSANPGLFHQMPSDGTGAYMMVIANFLDPTTNALTIETSPSTQPMMWGAGANENPPDGRVGTQGELAWLDRVTVNGMHDIGECYTLLYTVDLCPNPLAPMMAFWGEAGGPPQCYANCDGSTTVPVLNVADFSCFLTKFAQQDPYANCDGSTTIPTLNVADFSCFLTKFAQGCP